MVNPNPVGMHGERLAREYLTHNGYSIVASNYSTRFGEIDIIAARAHSLIFIEVKTRTSTEKGYPYEAVRAGKMRRMVRAIHMFLATHSYNTYTMRAWVISIILKHDLSPVSFTIYDDVPLKVS
ncbi:MAG: hypothetical protein RI947_581 [Candidatus Parcubacteria bacterium]|jgi:putative endonuclease